MKLDILAFGAHPDDVELSAGATLLKYSAEGKSIGIIDLTEGELGTRGNSVLRYEESGKAAKILKLKTRKNLNLGDCFFEDSNENKIKIIELIRHHEPELVLANSVTDRHPDHGRAAKLVSEACYLSGLEKITTSYEGSNQAKFRPRLLLHYIQDYYLTPDVILDISSHGDQKIDLIKCYKSQFFDVNSKEPKTPISGEEFFVYVEGRMLSYGRELGVKYGEAFNVSRTLGTKDLFVLK
jgi:bacillithiol biosynthesis deacetylase BshB1